MCAPPARTTLFLGAAISAGQHLWDNTLIKVAKADSEALRSSKQGGYRGSPCLQHEVFDERP